MLGLGHSVLQHDFRWNLEQSKSGRILRVQFKLAQLKNNQEPIVQYIVHIIVQMYTVYLLCKCVSMVQ